MLGDPEAMESRRESKTLARPFDETTARMKSCFKTAAERRAGGEHDRIETTQLGRNAP
jgi:hypothetical protein